MRHQLWTRVKSRFFHSERRHVDRPSETEPGKIGPRETQPGKIFPKSSPKHSQMSHPDSGYSSLGPSPPAVLRTPEIAASPCWSGFHGSSFDMSFKAIVDDPGVYEHTDVMGDPHWSAKKSSNSDDFMQLERRSQLDHGGAAAPSGSSNSDAEHCRVTESQPDVKTTESRQSASEGELSFIGAGDATNSHFSAQKSIEPAVQACLNLLADRIVHHCLLEGTKSGFQSCAPSQQDSSRGSSASSTSQTRLTSGTQGSRSSRNGGHEEPRDLDEQASGRPPSTRKRPHDGSARSTRLLACPYAKFDPRRYSHQNSTELNYRKCSSVCLRDIPRVKQHLYRVHARPTYYCASCYEAFKSRGELDQHIRQRPPCNLGTPQYEERMTDAQHQEVKRRIVRGDRNELWFNIFAILFPGSPLPPTPYVSSEDASVINHFVNLFLHVGPEEILNLIRDREENGGQHPLLQMSTRNVVDEAFEIALPMYMSQMNRLQLNAHPSCSRVRLAEGSRDDEAGAVPISLQSSQQPDGPGQRVQQTSLGAHVTDANSMARQWLHSNNNNNSNSPHNDALVFPEPPPPVDDHSFAQPYDPQAWPETHFDPAELNGVFDGYGQLIDAPNLASQQPVSSVTGQTMMSGAWAGFVGGYEQSTQHAGP